jgi:hypothetical protein
MTNGPQGPGWWQASDGNWYPPAQDPNQAPPVHAGAQASQGIAVTMHIAALVPILVKPTIVVDGSEIPGVKWGRAVVPTGPGQHHVHVHISILFQRRMGRADTVVEVQPGGLAELEYKAPAWQWSPGSLGVGPQRYNGVGISVGVYLVLAALGAMLALAAHRPVGAIVAIAFVVNAVIVLVKSSSNPSAGQPPGQQAAVAPGWYADPSDPNLRRYFDGRDWTSQTAPRG